MEVADSEMRTPNKGLARWGVTSLVAAGVMVWSGCVSTPKSEEEPVAEGSEPVAERSEPVAEAPAGVAPAPTAGVAPVPGPAIVAPIQPFSPAYYAERLAEIEAGLRPLTSIPAPIASQRTPPPQLHNR